MTPFPIGILFALVAQTPPATAAPRYERPIVIAAPGPQRLAVDATLLAGAAPFTVVRAGNEGQRAIAEHGLSDLRLADKDGREVPYLLVHAAVPEAQWLPTAVQPIAATPKTSGFEADLGSAQDVNGLDVRRLPGPFMKRFSLEGSADREHWTQMIPEGTLFDLPDRQLRQTDASFAAGRYRYLRVTWDDTHSGRVPLPPAVFVRLAVTPSPPAPVVVPLRFERRPSEPGRSRYHVTLPGNRLPIVALRLDAGGTYVFRSVTVTEPRLAAWQAAPSVIGEGMLVRDRSGTTLRVAVQQPTLPELDVLVEDGNNPPLDLRSIAAEFAELPWIYVDAPGPLVARYGVPGLAAPVYDLEAARPSLRVDTLPEARWGAPVARTETSSGPSTADAAAMTGAPLDASSFRYSRDLAAGGAGLVALPLDAAVLAHSAGPGREFADVRIVDSNGRQVPRLVERRPEPLVIPLRAQPASATAAELQPKPGANRSIYHVDLPFAALPEARIVLSTTSRVFQRYVQLGYERPPDRGHRDPWFLPIASAGWSRTEEAPAALTLPLTSPVADATQLTLVVDEGDNGALPISDVQLLLPSYRLRFVRPATAARLVYGSSTIDVPRYDLALLAPAVLDQAAADVTMSAEAGTGTGVTPALISPRLFWVLLGVAVVALLGVLVALVRSST